MTYNEVSQVLSKENRERKKEQMLKECFELFTKQGLENTSLNDLTVYCKTYKAAFYNYFKSKDEIVLEAAKMYMTNLDDKFFREFLNPQPTLLDALKRGFCLITDEKDNLRFIYQILSSPKYGATCQKELIEIYTKYMDYSDIFAHIYKVDKDEFRTYYLLYIGTIHDYCLWGNEKLVNEKLDFIYSKVNGLDVWVEAK